MGPWSVQMGHHHRQQCWTPRDLVQEIAYFHRPWHQRTARLQRHPIL